MPNDAILIASAFGSDSTLERIWRDQKRLAAELKNAAYDLVTIPSFSLWDGRPPIEHRYNIVRGLRLFEFFAANDLATIPTVSWFSPADLRDWIQELRQWKHTRAFSLDLATLDTRQKWAWWLQGLRELFHSIGTDWEVLINGVGTRVKISDIARVLPHFHLINERPYQLAMAGFVTRDEFFRGHIRPTTPLTRMQIFEKLVSEWSAAVPTANECVLTDSRVLV